LNRAQNRVILAAVYDCIVGTVDVNCVFIKDCDVVCICKFDCAKKRVLTDPRCDMENLSKILDFKWIFCNFCGWDDYAIWEDKLLVRWLSRALKKIMYSANARCCAAVGDGGGNQALCYSHFQFLVVDIYDVLLCLVMGFLTCLCSGL
jgi:hypothetical protein